MLVRSMAFIFNEAINLSGMRHLIEHSTTP
jgi:hypothetical protein